jgi:hypothetical protein
MCSSEPSKSRIQSMQRRCPQGSRYSGRPKRQPKHVFVRSGSRKRSRKARATSKITKDRLHRVSCLMRVPGIFCQKDWSSADWRALRCRLLANLCRSSGLSVLRRLISLRNCIISDSTSSWNIAESKGPPMNLPSPIRAPTLSWCPFACPSFVLTHLLPMASSK